MRTLAEFSAWFYTGANLSLNCQPRAISGNPLSLDFNSSVWTIVVCTEHQAYACSGVGGTAAAALDVSGPSIFDRNF